MNIIGVLLSYFLFLNIAFTQDIYQIDSVGMEICASIKLNSNLTDIEILALIQKEHISPYRSKQKSKIQDSMLDHLLFRTERLCPEYSALAYRTSDNNGDWILLSQKPETRISDDLCTEFFNNKSYYYLEPTGDRVRLIIQEGYWVDRFIDDTYSKLKLIEKSNCEFDIQFIESNNSKRKKFSKIGDTYSYQILNYEDDKYYMSVEIPGQKQYYKFILYINE